MALSAAAQEAMALRYLGKDFNIDDTKPLLIYEDNQGAIAMSKNPTSYAKTKHIHIRHHFIRDAVEAGIIHVEYIHTSLMVADILTKSTTLDIFRKLTEVLLGKMN
jgi:hypothetical protein